MFMSSPLGFFWLFLAIAFFAMAWYTYKMRQVIVPKKITEAKAGACFAGDDVAKLKPIFDDMLKIEALAFLLTAIAAFVDFLIRLTQ
jgi:hypothetical protein